MFTAIAFLILCKSLQALDIAVPEICVFLPCISIAVWALLSGVYIVLKIIDALS